MMIIFFFSDPLKNSTRGTLFFVVELMLFLFEKQNVHQVIGVIKKVEEIIHFRMECRDSLKILIIIIIYDLIIFFLNPLLCTARLYNIKSRFFFIFSFLFGNDSILVDLPCACCAVDGFQSAVSGQ